MTIARSKQISLEHTEYYHCTTRCVRRAFLCGKDRYSGRSFEHRRAWLEKRLAAISGIFAIDLIAYAVMSNHYHVVVRINAAAAESWSDEEVIDRWRRLYNPPEESISATCIALWRTRLMNLSWFMRAINEPVARMANREDRCKGRFWEGRFKCQALLDDSAVLRCMAYVDLNPIRAGMATTPEASRHTSLKSRIDGNDGHLMPFQGHTSGVAVSIPMEFREYLQLVDWTGRRLRHDKRGIIPATEAPVLNRLGIDREVWVGEMRHYGKWYYRAVGSLQSLQQYCEHLGQRWLKGMGPIHQHHLRIQA